MTTNELTYSFSVVMNGDVDVSWNSRTEDDTIKITSHGYLGGLE